MPNIGQRVRQRHGDSLGGEAEDLGEKARRGGLGLLDCGNRLKVDSSSGQDPAASPPAQARWQAPHAGVDSPSASQRPFCITSIPDLATDLSFLSTLLTLALAAAQRRLT